VALGVTINLQQILVYLGKAYNDETGLPSIYTASLLSSGPVYEITLSRNLVASYTYGNNPLSTSDFNTLSNFSAGLQTLGTSTAQFYANLAANFLSSEFNKIGTFSSAAYGTDIRSYLNTYQYVTYTGPVYDVHGGFSLAYSNFYNNSLVSKVAEIDYDGINATMTVAPLTYPGIGGLTRPVVSSLTGSNYTGPYGAFQYITDENVTTVLYSGPNNSIIEYAATGTMNISFIAGSSVNYRTLAYPRMNNAGYGVSGSSITGSQKTITFSGTSFIVQPEPNRRYPGTPQTFILKATNVYDNGNRNFVFTMLKTNTTKGIFANTDQTIQITLNGSGPVTIIGTNGNTSYYRPFSLVSTQYLQAGETFEIWTQQ